MASTVSSDQMDSQTVEQRLHQALLELEPVGGVTGWAARKVLSAGNWIEREFKERKQMIGGIDNMWLLLSDVAPNFNPVCASTYTMKSRLSLEALEMAALRQAEEFPKYKERPVSMGRRLHGPHFEPDPDFNVKFHVRAATLQQPAGKRELDNLMGEFIARRWDLRRPLWEILLVDNYHDEEGAECALVTRGHHTLADGQGFVLSQLYMTSYHDDLVKKMNNGRHEIEAAKIGRLRPSHINTSLRFLDPLGNHALTAPLVQAALALIFWSTYFLSVVVSFFWSTYQGIHQFFLFLLTCWRVEMLTDDYLGPRVIEREFSSSKTFSIDDVKLCQRAFSGPPGRNIRKPKLGGKSTLGGAGHVTLNDVACSVMVDVLEEERMCKSHIDTPWNNFKQALHNLLPSPIGFFIPISLRDLGDFSMRNLSTGSVVYLSPAESLDPTISIRQLHSHIHACSSELSLLKHSLWPKVAFDLIQLTGQAPIAWPVPFALFPRLLFDPVRQIIRDWITIPLVRFSLETVPVVLTNVPGPTKKLTLGGAQVLKWTALPPQAGKGTIGVGIISYAGGLCISVATDKLPWKEGVASRICRRFEQRFELYVAKARQILESEHEQ